jgi:hypothetical protein
VFCLHFQGRGICHLSMKLSRLFDSQNEALSCWLSVNLPQFSPLHISLCNYSCENLRSHKKEPDSKNVRRSNVSRCFSIHLRFHFHYHLFFYFYHSLITSLPSPPPQPPGLIILTLQDRTLYCNTLFFK